MNDCQNKDAKFYTLQILQKYYCLSEDNNVCPELGDSSVVYATEFHPIMFVAVLLGNEPIKCERRLARQAVIQLEHKTSRT